MLIYIVLTNLVIYIYVYAYTYCYINIRCVSNIERYANFSFRFSRDNNISLFILNIFVYIQAITIKSYAMHKH